MKDKLEAFGLTPSNSIVIGSGILAVLSIRTSKDIDVIVTQSVYDSLKNSGKFTISETHGREILVDDMFEIGTNWEVLGKQRSFEDLVPDSIVINSVRYITLDFLYRVKKSWLQDGEARPKDIADVELIENYLQNKL